MRSNTRWWMGWFSALLIVGFFLNLTMFNMLCYSTSRNDEGPITEQELGDHKLLVILVMTAPTNYERRKVIRDTWLSKLPSQLTKVYFVLGSKNLDSDMYKDVLKERDKHRDLMILESIEDSYFKLTEKVVHGLAVSKREHNSTYIMKCDDDTFIDSLRLLERLKTLPASRLYWGYFTGAARVKTQGQWAEPNYYLCDRYLPYARGGGYLLTHDIVEYILRNRDILQIYNSEDVTIGIWLAPLNITRLHETGFDTEATSRGCLNHHIVSHKQSISDMISKQASLEKSGKLCSQEIRHRKEYIYNWKVPPSQCCVM